MEPSTSKTVRRSVPTNPGLLELIRGKREKHWKPSLEELRRGFRGWHQRGYLPHFDAPNVSQVITFQLADSFPVTRRAEWEPILRESDDSAKRRKLEVWLDRGYGESLLRRQEVRAPMAGRVVERKVDLGTAVGRDNLETELFVIADLDRVWVDLAVSPADLPLVREGQGVVISVRAAKEKADGKIVFISPLLDKETRSARVVAEIANGEGVWRPGSFVTAAIAVDEQAARLVVPSSSVQTVGSDKIVFVRTADGFEKRPVVIGRNDSRFTEIVSGLQGGEIVAAANAFLLKAEMLKGQLED